MWDRKDTARPAFFDIVATLSSYLEVTSDYLDLGDFPKESKPEQQADEECVSGRCIKHIPSNPNDYVTHNPPNSNNTDYYMAGSLN